MSGELLVAILGSTGLGAIIAAVINGYFSHRKLGAEATKIISDAAVGVVERIEDELERQTDATETAKRRLIQERERWHEERLAWRRLMREWGSWEATVIEAVRAAGIEGIPPPPPTYPPEL